MAWSKLADEDQEATINNITVLDTLTGARNGMAGHRQTTMYNTFLIIISGVIDTSISKTTFKGYISQCNLQWHFWCKNSIVWNILWAGLMRAKNVLKHRGEMFLFEANSVCTICSENGNPQKLTAGFNYTTGFIKCFSLSGKTIQLFFLWIKSKCQQKRGASLREEKNP